MGESDFLSVEVDFNLLSETNNGDDFLVQSVNLSNEVITNVFLILGIKEDDDPNKLEVSHHKAILYGIVLRAIKLFRAYVEMLCKNRDEAESIIGRAIYESLINVKYLIQMNSDELFDEFIKYSLIAEKKLYIQIQDNIKARGNQLPIEERMMISINRSFIRSGFDIGDIQMDYKKNKWGSITLPKKAAALFDKGKIPPGFNHSVHGNWQSIMFSDLIFNDNSTFTPLYRYRKSKPQLILALMVMFCLASYDFINHVFSREEIKIYASSVFMDTESKIRKIDELHEKFIVDQR